MSEGQANETEVPIPIVAKTKVTRKDKEKPNKGTILAD
jgi:hypothetical protein